MPSPAGMPVQGKTRQGPATVRTMKLTDYLADFLAREGVTHVFGLTGGAIVHPLDSVERHPRLKAIYPHHEQTVSFAAEAYSRVTENFGAAFVTTGPGGTNAITGLCAAWLDSIPCLFLSGQTRFEHTTHGKPIRQLGSQHIDIVPVVTPLTKYAVRVEDPNKIRYYLEKAVYVARTGRPGPVWVDLPLDFQWAMIDPETLPGFDPVKERLLPPTNPKLPQDIRACVELLRAAKRPLLLLGAGIRLAHGAEACKRLIEQLQIPFVSTWNTIDLMPSAHPLAIGLTGIAGQRGANLAVQNCDLLLCIGSHLCPTLTGLNFKAYAREAKKVMVDIDPVELAYETVTIDLPIHADAKAFINGLLEQPVRLADLGWWRERCAKYKLYNAVPASWRDQKTWVNPYVFLDVLSDELDHDDVIAVDGGGTALFMALQWLKVKDKQRLIVSAGIGAMGAGLPESIGACVAHGNRRTICIIGDGSMQFNIQELQTMLHHQLPIKIMLINNDGYLSIRHTQDQFFEGRRFGTDATGGLSLPDFQKVAAAYGVKTTRIQDHAEMLEKLRWALNAPGPVVCEVMVDRAHDLIPRMGFTKNPDGTFTGGMLEDMYPYLDRKELLENMIVKPWE